MEPKVNENMVKPEEDLQRINQNAIEYAKQLAKGWAPGSWEEANITLKRKIVIQPGGCECGHRLADHKQTMPGKILCIGCLNEVDNRSVIGCETFILKNADAI